VAELQHNQAVGEQNHTKTNSDFETAGSGLSPNGLVLGKREKRKLLAKRGAVVEMTLSSKTPDNP